MFGSIEPFSFIFRVNGQNGRTVEELVSPRSPLVDAPSVGGAVVEAAYLVSDPPLVPRLAQAGIPWVADSQVYRFSSAGFKGRGKLASLPYAPAEPLNPLLNSPELRRVVRGALEFQAMYEPAMYLVPSLPLLRPSARALTTFRQIHELAVDLNGSTGIPHRPMLAAAYPGIAVMRGRFSVFDRLEARAFAGAYVQALNLNAKRDSLEKLVSYTSFLEEGLSAGLPIFAGKPGTFGLVLGAFGIEHFDSALGDGESFSLARLDYQRPRDAKGRTKGGHQRRVYYQQLLTTLSEHEASWIAENRAIRGQLGCDIDECQHGGYRYALDHPRVHFFHVRQAELLALKSQATASLRVAHLVRRLESAIEAGQLVNRVREQTGQRPLDFRYLDRWLSALARVATVVAVR